MKERSLVLPSCHSCYHNHGNTSDGNTSDKSMFKKIISTLQLEFERSCCATWYWSTSKTILSSKVESFPNFSLKTIGNTSDHIKKRPLPLKTGRRPVRMWDLRAAFATYYGGKQKWRLLSAMFQCQKPGKNKYIFRFYWIVTRVTKKWRQAILVSFI